jgi:L-fuconolactonase
MVLGRLPSGGFMSVRDRSERGHSRREFLAQSAAWGGAMLPGLGACAERSQQHATAPLAGTTGVRIDAHQHFWTYSSENYPWIDDSLASLRRNFAPADLLPELQRASVSGTVLIEARSAVEETENLLAIAQQTELVRGVVGWLPLSDPTVGGLIERFAAQAKFRGLRHAIFADADPELMLREDFNRGIALLAPQRLTYDLLLVPGNLALAPRFVDRHPRQVFILDHLAKPLIRERQLEPWSAQLRELSRRPNVYCKLSGLTTEADRQGWQASDLSPYLDVALEAFTPARLMFGSDWPMCTVATSYQRWFDTVQHWLAAFSSTERERILGGTAVEVYRL